MAEEPRVHANTADNAPESSSTWGEERPRKADTDLLKYLVSVSTSLDSLPVVDSSVEDADIERHSLIANVFEELQQNEASISAHPKGSFVVEKFLKICLQHPQGHRILVTFLINCKQYFLWLATNARASHVLQTWLDCAYRLMNNGIENGEVQPEKEDTSGDESKKDATCSVHLLVVELCNNIFNTGDWWKLAYDSFGTHIVRTLLCVISGDDPTYVLTKGKGKSKRHNKLLKAKPEKAIYDVSHLKPYLLKALTDVEQWKPDELTHACKDVYASPVIQLILEKTAVKNNRKLWNSVLDHLCDEVKIFKDLITHRVSSHVMQICLTSCTKKQFNKMFDLFLTGNLLETSSDPVANYVLQHALQSVNTEKQIEQILEELTEGISSTLLKGHMGVIYRLAEACLTYRSAQLKFCRALLKGVRAKAKGKRAGAVEILLELQRHIPVQNTNTDHEQNRNEGTISEYDASRSRVSSLGALTLEALIKFDIQNNRAFLESLAAVSADDLCIIAKDPIGARRVLEPLMDSPKTHSWARQRVLGKILPKVLGLCENKNSWRIFMKAFDNGTFNDKLLITKPLSKASTRLAGNSFGRTLLKHCKVQVYKEQPGVWEKDQKREKKSPKRKEQVLKEFMSELEEVKPKKKRKKKKTLEQN